MASLLWLCSAAAAVFISERNYKGAKKEPFSCHYIQKLTSHFMKYKSTPISKMKYMNMKNNRDKTLISVMGITQ